MSDFCVHVHGRAAPIKIWRRHALISVFTLMSKYSLGLLQAKARKQTEGTIRFLVPMSQQLYNRDVMATKVAISCGRTPQCTNVDGCLTQPY